MGQWKINVFNVAGVCSVTVKCTVKREKNGTQNVIFRDQCLE